MCRLSALFVSFSFSADFPTRYTLRYTSYLLRLICFTTPSPAVRYMRAGAARGPLDARAARGRAARDAHRDQSKAVRVCLSKLNLAGLREQGCQPTHLLFRESVVPLLPITCRTLPCASRGAPSQPPPIGHAPVNNAWVARSSCRGLGPRHLAWDGRVVLYESLETTGNGAQRCNAPNRRSGL